ncbi:MAG: ECF subfamily RNA polymerase sigma factor [Candidatus Peregrinibacteria bacterium Greene0416_19]|nr:MAG: ECF subfamily RNA polymerase sigma factor [Candidatus Peregrinibacteria bacterium Greene0416_19]
MPPIPLSEAELQVLVRKAQDGDTEAFGKVYDHYFLQVYRYTSFRSQREMVEDLVADVFVKAWEKLHTYKPRKDVPFGAWLFRIARHVIIDTYRRNREIDEMPDDLLDPDRLNHADASVAQHDLLQVVRGALDMLPRRYREILILSYVSELTHKEVARSLRMTEGGVRILKFRALRKLETFLPEEWRRRAEHGRPFGSEKRNKPRSSPFSQATDAISPSALL